MFKLIFFIVFFSFLSASFPESVIDIYNNTIDVKEIVEKKNLIIITLKNPECSVCQNQLIRIRENFNKFTLCNVSFLVLTSGENSNIENAQIKTEFSLERWTCAVFCLQYVHFYKVRSACNWVDFLYSFFFCDFFCGDTKMYPYKNSSVHF